MCTLCRWRKKLPCPTLPPPPPPRKFRPALPSYMLVTLFLLDNVPPAQYIAQALLAPDKCIWPCHPHATRILSGTTTGRTHLCRAPLPFVRGVAFLRLSSAMSARSSHSDSCFGGGNSRATERTGRAAGEKAEATPTMPRMTQAVFMINKLASFQLSVPRFRGSFQGVD